MPNAPEVASLPTAEEVVRDFLERHKDVMKERGEVDGANFGLFDDVGRKVRWFGFKKLEELQFDHLESFEGLNDMFPFCFKTKRNSCFSPKRLF